MKQTTQILSPIDSQPQKLPSLPQGSLASGEQKKNLHGVQKKDDEWVERGMQIHKVAEEHFVRHEALVGDVQTDQERLKEQLQQDESCSLQTCCQWMGKIDEDFTSSLKSLERRIDDLQARWSKSQQRIDNMMQCSDVCLEQSCVSAGSIAGVAGKSHTPAGTTVACPRLESESQS